MNFLWTLIMLAAITAMLLVCPGGAVKAMTTGANNAVTLALTLMASYSLWLGFFKLVEKTRLSGAVARAIRKPLRFLFPGVSADAEKYLSMNISANFLGLGNAATPMGINAVLAMDDGEEKASPNLIMMLVLSATSFQLLPGTVIAMRIARGSSSPVSFLPANLIATSIATITGITLVKLLSRRKRRENASPSFASRRLFGLNRRPKPRTSQYSGAQGADKA